MKTKTWRFGPIEMERWEQYVRVVCFGFLFEIFWGRIFWNLRHHIHWSRHPDIKCRLGITFRGVVFAFWWRRHYWTEKGRHD